jgi:hypothetical protein
MNDDEKNFTTPPEDFEMIEVDVNAFLTEEQRSWPVVSWEMPEQDFASEVLFPRLVLTLELPAVNGRMDTERLSAVVTSASECEAGFGGSGLDEWGRQAANGTATLTLVPRTLLGARERLTRVARIAAGFAGTKTASVV